MGAKSFDFKLQLACIQFYFTYCIKDAFYFFVVFLRADILEIGMTVKLNEFLIFDASLVSFFLFF